MALAASDCFSVSTTPNFQARIRYCLVKTAVAVLDEPLNTAGHALRAEFAKAVLSSNYDIFGACLAMWTDDALKASGNTNNQETFGLNDTEVLAAVAAKFSALAGVETGT